MAHPARFEPDFCGFNRKQQTATDSNSSLLILLTPPAASKSSTRSNVEQPHYLSCILQRLCIISASQRSSWSLEINNTSRQSITTRCCIGRRGWLGIVIDGVSGKRVSRFDIEMGMIPSSHMQDTIQRDDRMGRRGRNDVGRKGCALERTSHMAALQNGL